MGLKFPIGVMICVFLLSSLALAQSTKLNAGYSAISADQLPAWIAKETGIFKKNGLDIQLIYFTGGTTAVQALVSGEVPSHQPTIYQRAAGYRQKIRQVSARGGAPYPDG